MITPCGLEKSPKKSKPWTLRGMYLHLFLCHNCKEWLKKNNPARQWRQEAKAWIADLKESVKQ